MADTHRIIHLTDKIQNFHLPALTKCSRTTTRRLFTLMVLTPTTRIRNRATNPTAIILIVLRSNRSRSPMRPPTLMCPRFALLRSILHMSNLLSLSRRATCPGTVTSRPSRPTADTGTIARRVVLTLAGLVIRRLRRRPPPPLPPLPTGLRRCFPRFPATSLLTTGLGNVRTRRLRCRQSSHLSPRTDRRRECCRRNFLFRL